MKIMLSGYTMCEKHTKMHSFQDSQNIASEVQLTIVSKA